jgi:hypothetical protein
VGVKNILNEAPERRNRHRDRHTGMLHKHVQSDSKDFVKRMDNPVNSSELWANGRCMQEEAEGKKGPV